MSIIYKEKITHNNLFLRSVTIKKSNCISDFTDYLLTHLQKKNTNPETVKLELKSKLKLV